MKNFISGTFSVLVLLLLVACVPGTPEIAIPTRAAVPETKEVKEPWEAQWSKVVAEARKEGELLIYGTVGAETVDQLTRALKEKYGITLNVLAMQRGPEMAERILRERRAGLYTLDVILVGATTLIGIMKPAGYLADTRPVLMLPEVLDAKAWYGGNPFLDKERKIVPLIGSFQRHVTRNTNLVKEGDIKSFRDLLNPVWKGKIIVNDPTSAGAGNAWVSLMVYTWDMEPTKDYLRQFVTQEPTITRDGRLQIESLSRGKYALAIATRIEVSTEFMALGAPIAHVRTTEGGNMTGSGGVLALPQNPAHPNAAAVFVNWVMSKEGQAVFSKGFGSPAARVDVPPPPGYDLALLPAPGEPVQIEDEESLKIKSTVLLDIAKDIFAPLMR